MNTSTTAPRRIAVIGTAGRDKAKPMDRTLWEAMCADLQGRVRPDDELVSGGAAWSDHLAVHAFLNGWCAKLTLFLPAPFCSGNGAKRFEGTGRSAGAIANYYHEQFWERARVDSFGELAEAIERGATVHAETAGSSVNAMFRRNGKVAQYVTDAIAYTFGEGQGPADGGTADTWHKIAARQLPAGSMVHVSLGNLVGERQGQAAPPARCGDWHPYDEASAFDRERIEGWRAQRAGQSRDANPYAAPAGAEGDGGVRAQARAAFRLPRFARWNEGFERAQREQQRQEHRAGHGQPHPPAPAATPAPAAAPAAAELPQARPQPAAAAPAPAPAPVRSSRAERFGGVRQR